MKAMSSSSPKFSLFISHAGEDKATIAIPLRAMLYEHRVAAFVDEKDIPLGCNATQEMTNAMETALVAVVILSPEYVARKWSIKELLCFIKRRGENSHSRSFPVILPLFYRLTIDDLYHEPRLDRKDAHGKSLYRASRFYERMDNGEPEADIPTIKAALRTLHGIMGIKNDVQATNDSSSMMRARRKLLLEHICTAILIIRKQNSQPDPRLQGPQIPDDTFRPFFHLEHDTADLILDFERKDDNGVSCTVEARLLDVILDGAPDADREISVHGIGGVGKTSLLRALSSLDRVRTYFEDGSYYLSLSLSAKLLSITNQLSRAVEQSGGKSVASSMRQESDWRRMLKLFREWFANKKCLFLVDDIWEVGEISSHVVYELLTLNASGRESKVVCTTRSPTVASRCRCFKLNPRDPFLRESRDILSRHAGIRLENRTTMDKSAVDCILKVCGGLPLFLAIAGKAIRALNIRTGATENSAYHIYASSCTENMQSLLHTSVNSYERLEATLSLSIDTLERRAERSKFGFELRLRVSEMYRRLCVLEKQTRVPMEMLKNLWELDNSSQAAIIAREFEQFGLVDMEMDKRNDRYVELLRLHDCLHLYATQQTRLHGSVVKCHEQLLHRYASADSDLCCSRSGERYSSWWSRRLQADGYIHANLCRHLKEAEQVTVFGELLQRPQWMERQVEVNDVFKLEEDFVLYIQATENVMNESKRQCFGTIKLIQEALKLSSGFIARNPRELRFQMYGRLLGEVDNSEGIRTFLKRVRTDVDSAWLRSMNQFLQGPGSFTKRIIPVGVNPRCMTAIEGKDYALIGYGDGTVIAVNLVRGTIERKWLAHDKQVTVLSSTGGRILLTGSLDGSIKVWNVEDWTCALTFDDHKPDEIFAIAISEDGRKVVSVSSHVTVAMWDIDTGEILPKPGRIYQHLLRCFGIFPDGKQIAVAQEIPTERRHVCLGIWDITTASKVGEEFDGQCQDLICLKISQDARWIVSGCYTGIIRIWNIEDRREVTELLPHCEGLSGPVSSIAISRDGKRIVAKYGDHQIGVWDYVISTSDSHYQLSHKFGDSGSSFVQMSLLDRRNAVVTLSKDGHVRMWALNQRGKQHSSVREENFTKVVFTPDGRRAVTGTSRGTLEVWDASTGLRIRSMPSCWDIPGDVTTLAIRQDGRIIACVHVFGLADKNVGISLWDADTGAKLWQVRFEGLDFLIIPWYIATPGMEFVFTGFEGDCSAEVWELARGVPSHWPIKGHTKPVRNVFVSDDFLRMLSLAYSNSCNEEGELFVWDIQAREAVRRVKFEASELATFDRRKVMELAGEVTQDPDLRERQRDMRIQTDHTPEEILRISTSGETREVLGTLESKSVDSAFSPDNKVLCAVLKNDQIAFLRLESPAICKD